MLFLNTTAEPQDPFGSKFVAEAWVAALVIKSTCNPRGSSIDLPVSGHLSPVFVCPLTPQPSKSKSKLDNFILLVNCICLLAFKLNSGVHELELAELKPIWMQSVDF